MALPGEGGHDGVRRAPVADLDGVSVLHDASDVPSDSRGDLVGHPRRVLEERFVVVDEEIHLVHVDEAVAVNARHVAVDLGDDERRVPGGCRDDVDAHAKAEETVVVGEGGLDERDVDRNELPLEEIRNLREEDRRVVGQPLVHGPARVGPDEEGVVPEVVPQALVGVGSNAERPDVHDLGVAESLRVRPHVVGQSMDEVLRLRARGAEEDPVPAPDVPEDLVYRKELLGRAALELFQVALGCAVHGCIIGAVGRRKDSYPVQLVRVAAAASNLSICSIPLGPG